MFCNLQVDDSQDVKIHIWVPEGTGVPSGEQSDDIRP